MEIVRKYMKETTIHGAVPYIMEMAMMYASPMVIVALKEGMKRKKGMVRSVKIASISQPL